MSETLREGVERLAATWEGWGHGRWTPRIDAFCDAAEDLRALLAATAPTPDEVGLAVAEALEGAAESVDVASDRLRLDPKVQAGMLRASRIVRSQATTRPLTASQPTSGPEDQRGADGRGEA